MKILLDECIDWRFIREFPEHEVSTVSRMGWKSLKNGKLLRQAEKQFDVFMTVDKNIRFQQNLTQLKISLIILRVLVNDLDHLKLLAPQVNQTLKTLTPSEVVILDEKNQG